VVYGNSELGEPITLKGRLNFKYNFFIMLIKMYIIKINGLKLV
jgi:hypothetical protein